MAASVSVPRQIGSLQAAGSTSSRAGEVKGVDKDLSQSIIATTTTNGSIDVINLIAPGSGSWNRIGKKTVLKSVRIMGNLNWAIVPTFATGAGGRSIPVRCAIVWDNQPTGTIPTFDTIFGTTDQTGAEATVSIFDPVKYDNMERFRVLRDWKIDTPAWSVPSFGTAPSVQIEKAIDEYVKLPNLVSIYSGQSSPQTIADIASGALYILWRTTSSTAAASVTWDGMARLRYYD